MEHPQRPHRVIPGGGKAGALGDANPPYFLAFRSSTAFIVGTVCLAVFSDILLYGLIVPVIPYALTERAGVPEEDLQTWNAILLACYSLALFLGSPVAGLYADHTSSRRFPLLLGLLALGGSTVLLCLGKTIALFILGRILQGLSAAIVWSVGLALLADTVGRNIGLYMGYVSIAMSVGLLISPLIGGSVYGAAGYYAVYYVAFALVVCDIVLRLLLIEKKIARQWIPEGDSEGAATAMEEATPDVAASAAATAVVATATSAAAAATEAAAAVTETTAEAEEKEFAGSSGKDETSVDGEREDEAAGPKTLPRPQPTAPSSPRRKDARDGAARRPHWTLLKSRRMLAALFGTVIQAGIMFAFDTVIPLFVKETFEWSSTAAGLIFFCIFLPGFVSPWVGQLADRHGSKWLSLAGFVASLPLLVCLRFVTDNTTGHKVLLGALLALMGLTLTLSNVPLMAEITFAIEAKEANHPGIFGEKGAYGVGYGLFTTSFALGGTAGSLMAGYVNADAGWSTMTWSLAIWCAAGAVDVALWVGGSPPSGRPPPAGSDAGHDVERGPEADSRAS